jgi:hypothetical protein
LFPFADDDDDDDEWHKKEERIAMNVELKNCKFY